MEIFFLSIRFEVITLLREIKPVVAEIIECEFRNSSKLAEPFGNFGQSRLSCRVEKNNFLIQCSNEGRKPYVEAPMTEIKTVLIEKRKSFSQEDILSVAFWDFSVSHECDASMELSQF